MKKRLLNCPLCGSEAEIVEVGNEFFPKCKGGNGFCLLNRIPMEGYDGFKHLKDAIEVWNRRNDQQNKTTVIGEEIPEIVEYAKQLGFIELPHFTIGGNLICDVGRDRCLSLACAGTPNEMLCICTLNKLKDVYDDVIVIHNYDYDGYLTREKLKNIVNVFKNKDVDNE